MGCFPSKTSPKLKTVIIIGGGYGGSYLAHLLTKENFCKVILVEPKEMMVQTKAIPRSVVEPEFLKKVFIPYSKFVGENHIRNKVVSINLKKKSVLLENGNKSTFDYLVICSGRQYTFPQSLSEVAPAASIKDGTDFYKAFNSEMKQSPEIVLIGGNQFAVEMAGELRTDYPDKKIFPVSNSFTGIQRTRYESQKKELSAVRTQYQDVTIISENKKLLSDEAPNNLHTALEKLLYRKEVDLFLETSVVNEESLVYNKYEKEQIIKTSGNKEIIADFIIRCDQFSYSTEFCRNSLPDLSLNEKGVLKVDEYLKVKSCENVFAFGGVISSSSEDKTKNVKQQAKVIAANIQNLVLIERMQALEAFRPESLPIVVAFGSYDGAGFSNGELLDEEDEMLTRRSLDYFVDEMWHDLSVSIPQ